MHAGNAQGGEALPKPEGLSGLEHMPPRGVPFHLAEVRHLLLSLLASTLGVPLLAGEAAECLGY